MIFNMIEKQLRNFNTSPDKFQNKCPINFNILPSHYSKPREFILTQCKRDFQNRNLQSPTSNSNKGTKMLLRTLSGQKLKINKKLNENNQRKHKKSNSINQNLQQMKKRKQYVNLGLQNHIERLDYIQNIKIYDFKSPQSSHMKKENNQLSQTGISTGSELYELSPIHFNKYMEYIDKNSKKEAFSFGQVRYNYFAGQKKIKQVSNYMIVSEQKTSHIMDNHIQKEKQINLDQQKSKLNYSAQAQKQNKGQFISEIMGQSCQNKSNQNQLTFSNNQHKINEFKLKNSLNEEYERFSFYNSSNFWIFVSVFSVFAIFMCQIFR